MNDATMTDTALKFYIDGRWVEPSAPTLIDVVDPSTEEVFARVQEAVAGWARGLGPGAPLR